MAQNISTYIHPGFTLLAAGTANLDVRLSDIVDMRISLKQTWTSTASGAPTGLAVNLYPGTGGADPAETKWPIPQVLSNPASSNLSTIPSFANNYEAVTAANGYTAIVQPASGSLVTQSTNTIFFLSSPLIKWPEWIRIQVISLDASKPCVVQVLADI